MPNQSFLFPNGPETNYDYAPHFSHQHTVIFFSHTPHIHRYYNAHPYKHHSPHKTFTHKNAYALF